VTGRSAPWLALALAAFALRDLFAIDGRRLSADGLLEWFTIPDGIWFPLVLAGAAWLAWRRLPRFAALPERRSAPLACAALAGSILALAWALVTGVSDLLVWSLAGGALAAAAWRRGAAGARALALPAAFLLFAVAPPPRLVSEALWWIQSRSARAAAALVQATGLPVLGEGIVLSTPTRVFGIVESCAALGILIVLCAFAILLRERIAAAGARSWLLVAIAPALALALNLARITAIVLQPELNRLHHLGQWAILLGLGATLLAAVSALLGRGAPRAGARAQTLPVALPVRGATALGLALALAAASLLPVPAPARVRPQPEPVIRAEEAGFESYDVAIDRLFLGFVQFHRIVSRRYVRGDEVVDVFVGNASQRSDWSSPFSPKTILPGLRWVPLPLEDAQPLDVPIAPGATALVTRDGERWFAAQWRFGDPGVLRESLRQLFALDASPFAQPRPRRVVRLAALVDPDHPDDVGPAREAVAAFAREFAAELFEDAG
jgi:exosortase